MAVDGEFTLGYLVYETLRDASAGDVCMAIEGPWDDGFIAFSQGECRWEGKSLNPQIPLKEFLNTRYQERYLEGYPMEAGLWRQDGGFVFEEVSIERDGADFLLQKWELHTSRDTIRERRVLDCYYRHASRVMPLRRATALFNKNELSAIEVIVPDYRLHIFLTKKG